MNLFQTLSLDTYFLAIVHAISYLIIFVSHAAILCVHAQAFNYETAWISADTESLHFLNWKDYSFKVLFSSASS